MSKPQYDMSSSNALSKAERPHSNALSIMPKRSLNDAVDAWVRDGGKVTVVEGVKHKDVPPVETAKQRARRKDGKLV